MKLLGLDHIGIVVRDIDKTVARAGDTVDGRAVGERFVSDDIDLQVHDDRQIDLGVDRGPQGGV